MNDYKFGNFLCSLRENKGLTQAQLAETLKVTPAAVSKWENGESKPRIETLFQLAAILGVRAEELMAGEYIPNETLNQEKVNEIYKKYEYLQKTETYTTVNVKIRRCAAWVIDWILAWVLGFLISHLSIFLSNLFNTDERYTATAGMESMIIMLFSTIGFFVLRDFVFGVRSIGKIITDLIILDGKTGEKAKKWQCAIRNLFFSIYVIDLIVMLITGRSIGDMLAHTIVVSKKSYDSNTDIDDSQKANAINSYNEK